VPPWKFANEPLSSFGFDYKCASALRHSAELRCFLTAHDLESDAEWAGFQVAGRRTGSIGDGNGLQSSVMNGAHGAGSSGGSEGGGGGGGGVVSGGGGSVVSGGAGAGVGRTFGTFFKELRQTVVQSTAVATVGGALGIETPKPRVAEEVRNHRLNCNLLYLPSTAAPAINLPQTSLVEPSLRLPSISLPLIILP
jgi:hypothetical protein